MRYSSCVDVHRQDLSGRTHQLGSGLTVGQRILIPSGEGSNPSSPTNEKARSSWAFFSFIRRFGSNRGWHARETGLPSGGLDLRPGGASAAPHRSTSSSAAARPGSTPRPTTARCCATCGRRSRELGEYDGTALMEFKTKKEIIYLLNHLNVCTYEMDDTPPFLVNQEAIDVAIELCLTMNMDIIDEVHIARKQYLDGSHSHGLPAHGHRRRERLAALQGPAAHHHARQHRGGLLPRGEGQGPPDRLAHGPPGHAADGDRDGPGAASRPRKCATPSCSAAWWRAAPAACARASAPAART